jgi:Flp pilus assembly protein TadG
VGRFQKSDLGATLVETAIVLPLLLLLTFGIWTTARAWNVHNVLDHAAREAARIGATTGDTGRMQTVAQGEVQASSVAWADITPCIVVIDGPNTPRAGSIGSLPCVSPDPTSDDRVQVTLSFNNYQLDFLFFETTVSLNAKAIARLEPGI